MSSTFEPANLPTFRSTTQGKLAIFIGVLVLAVLTLLPGLVFSYKSVQEPWTLFRLARASLSLPKGHIVQYAGEAAAYRGEHLGGELLQASLIRLSGLPLESLALLPLGSLLLPALTFAVVRVISRSTWLAAWLALFSAWYYPRLFSHYAVQTYVWTDALFLCFVLLFWLWLRRPSAWLSLLLALIFAAAFLHYQTTPLWMIAALFSGVLLARWRKDLFPPGMRPPSWALPLVFLVIYLQFDTVFYGNFLGRLRQEPVDLLLAANFSGKVLAPLFGPLIGPLLGGQPSVVGAYASAPLSPPLATWTTLLAILGLSLPVLAWCLRKILRAVRSRQPSQLAGRVDDIFVWSLLLVFGVHTLVYSIYGALSLRLIDLVFPLLLPVVLPEFPQGRRIAHWLAPALAGCAVVGCLSYAAALQPDILAFETGRASDLFPRDSRLLADASTFGGLFLNASQEGNLLNLVWLDEDLYAYAAGQTRAGPAGFDYLVADRLGKPVISRGWVFYHPWIAHLPEIEANPQLDKIYTSDVLSVFQPAGRELPTAPIEAAASLQPSRPVWLEAGQIGLTVLWLVFFPGAVLALLLLPKLGLPQAETGSWPVFLALSAGLSVAIHTFAGYLANFTVLGLVWQPQLVQVVSIVLLIFLLAGRLTKPPPVTWNLLLFGFAVLVSWSLGAALVDQYRSEARLPGVEFFLTTGGTPGGQIFASVVNSSEGSWSCSLRLKMGGQPAQEYGTFRLSPGAVRKAGLKLPGETRAERLAFILGCEGLPSKFLHLNPVLSPQTGAARLSGEPDDLP